MKIKKILIGLLAFICIITTSCGNTSKNEDTSNVSSNISNGWSSNSTKHWHINSVNQIIDEAEHIWSNWIIEIPATDTTEGKKKSVCTVCGYERFEVIEELNHVHKYGEWDVTIVPTETEKGLLTRNCVKNDSTENYTLPSLNEAGYRYSIIKEPTCAEEGIKKYSYNVEGNIVSFGVDLELLKHDYKNGYCMVCNTPVSTEGLEYKLSDDGKYYIVTGIGSAKNESEIVIASYIKDIPVKKIGTNAFYSCTLTNVVIPASITSIGDSAFYNCSMLKNIIIPNSVIIIGDSLFYGCSRLTNVIIGNMVSNLGDQVFDGCNNITSIEIPDSVTNIGSYAFFNCSSLESIVIPKNVTSIGNYVFSLCTNLTSIIVSVENKVYDSRSNCNAIIETVSNKLIFGCKNTKIPSSVTVIGNYAFLGCKSLTNIEIPNSIISIEEGAFFRCSNLISIEIPNSVISIGSGSFSMCINLISIEIPNSVTIIPAYAFSGCSSLLNIEIPNNVTKIGEYAFDDCKSLTSIDIPDSITSIGIFTFYNCNSLQNVKLSNNIEHISSSAFVNCDSLQYNIYDNAFYLGNNTNPYLALIKSKSTNILSCVVNNKCKILCDSAFYNCNNLSSIDIPCSVINIGHSSLSNCDNLKSIVVDEDNEVYDSRDNCNAIIETASNKLIFGCKNTTIPNSITCIGDSAFYRCNGLINIDIPDSVTSIGLNAFYACSNLISIKIPNSVKSIENSAFNECVALDTVYYLGLPQEWNIINIDETNYSLFNATIYYYSESRPTDTTYKYWYYVDGIPTVYDPYHLSHDYKDGICTICGKREATYGFEYKLSDNEKYYSLVGIGTATDTSNIVIADEIDGIPVLEVVPCAFNGNDKIVSVFIPYGIKKIGYNAFMNCW